jgi:hypothetical protein
MLVLASKAKNPSVDNFLLTFLSYFMVKYN